MSTLDESNECIPMESEWSVDAMGIFAKDQTMSFNNRDSAVSDDVWVSSLLPMSSAPRSNRRKNKTIKDIPFYTDDQYKQEYQRISVFSTEPLTNEEWTARRLGRERKARAERKASRERNQRGLHEGQYFRSDQGDLDHFDTQDQETLMPQDIPADTIRNRGSRRPRHYHPGLVHRESMINRSRMVVSNTFRFIGSMSRRTEVPSTSEAGLFPTFVGRGGIGDTNGSDRAGLESFTGIRSRRRGPARIQAFDGDDESDEDTAFWTTGTARETILESDSSCGTVDEAESIPLFEEHQIMMENAVSSGDEFVEWNHFPEAQEDGKLPASPHDPFVQFNLSGL